MIQNSETVKMLLDSRYDSDTSGTSYAPYTFYVIFKKSSKIFDMLKKAKVWKYPFATSGAFFAGLHLNNFMENDDVNVCVFVTQAKRTYAFDIQDKLESFFSILSYFINDTEKLYLIPQQYYFYEDTEFPEVPLELETDLKKIPILVDGHEHWNNVISLFSAYVLSKELNLAIYPTKLRLNLFLNSNTEIKTILKQGIGYTFPLSSYKTKLNFMSYNLLKEAAMDICGEEVEEISGFSVIRYKNKRIDIYLETFKRSEYEKTA